MKTAEAWVNDSEGKWDAEYVRAIQADAIRHASEFVGEMPKRYNRMRAWDGPYRAACVFARSHLREMATDLIEESKE